MTLTLSVLRCPDGVPPETRQVGGGEFSIGRGTENDWVLSDPDRVMSKRHCVVSFHDGAWQVVDTSTNGTFLNHEMQRLGPDAPRVLRDGDRLIVGAYEIEVVLNGREASPVAGVQGERDALFGEDRITGDPFPMEERDPLSVAMQSIGLPLGFDPLATGEQRAEPALPASDHLPAFQESYRPPRTSFEVLPADWDGDDEPSIAPPKAKPAEPPVPEAPPPLPVIAEPLEPVLAPVPAPIPVPAPPSAADIPAGDALALILAGAGIEGEARGEPANILRALGSAFRAMVVGLRRLMIARAAVKGEFRIDQTMIRPVRNNPLKFSSDDDDALAALLSIGRRSDMSAADAISDALRDMRRHELAVSAAMQQAVRDMLDELEPVRLMTRLPAHSLDSLPGRRKARAWDAYEARHGEIVRALADDFDSVFGKSFARAYERAMADIAAEDEE
ncbi:MAG TPA: type VI secretion system-associated FHA domain protein TagH [Aliidongia sp.]|nr:type VI secretion system-associated FHA domain protein TagH [Aliidongia sp.]